MPRPWLQPPRLQRSFSALLAAWLLASVLPSPAAERFSIDPAHTYSVFEYNHWGLSLQRGRFDRNSGFIEIDMEQQTGAVNIEIESASIDTGIGFFNKILRSGDFFDVEKYPTIEFKSKKITGSSGKLQMIGDLTIHGTTREVTLDVDGPTPEMTDPWGNSRRGISATTTINRKDFGLVYNNLLKTGEAMVGDNVKIQIDAELVKKK